MMQLTNQTRAPIASRRERNAVISDVALTIFIIAIAAILSFIIVSLRRGNARLIHKLYFILAAGLMIWLAALIGIRLRVPIIWI